MGFASRRDRQGWAQVEPADEPTWIFAQVPEPKVGKNRLHLDVVATDVEAEIARLVGLGATRVADHEEYGYTWTLMTDPEGNEFDIARQLQLDHLAGSLGTSGHAPTTAPSATCGFPVAGTLAGVAT